MARALGGHIDNLLLTAPGPISARERLNVGPGDVLVFREQADGAIVVEAAAADLMALEGSITPQVKGVTIEDMRDAVEAGVTARYKRARHR